MVAVDYPIIHCYSGIRWLVTDYVDFCQLNLLKNSEIHWFQFIMNSSSHHTAMNYGSRSALFCWNKHRQVCLALRPIIQILFHGISIASDKSWWWVIQKLSLSLCEEATDGRRPVTVQIQTKPVRLIKSKNRKEERQEGNC